MPSSKSSVDKRDVYYRKGKSEGYRARSAYKLLHLDEEFDIFTGVQTAVDLCAAPGSWSQVLGNKLKPGPAADANKVVSLDLQPMAPLPNIAILQADITKPSTVPRVLEALGGRKADLVVCDGAPDVTGVHDLDAYLHSQLLLAALTLSLTLMAPGATLIFKIFLSPMDPRADMLRSQLRCFFPTSLGRTGPSDFDEFDEHTLDFRGDGAKVVNPDWPQASSSAQPIRPTGVWVRKPRSSRKGSGEAFIVCRGFDPATVPLPPSFSAADLERLRQSQETLSLETLATTKAVGSDWDGIKAYVGHGDVDAPSAPTATSPIIKTTPSPNIALRLQTDPRTLKKLESEPTPIEPDPDTDPSISLFPPSSSSNRLRPSPSLRRALGANRRQSDASETSPTNSFSTRPWDRHGPPSPLPSPMYDYPSMYDGGAPSPALSVSSKTDTFFSVSQRDTLPVPPKALAGPIGLGRPSKEPDGHRAVSQPALPTSASPQMPDISSFASASGIASRVVSTPQKASPFLLPHSPGSPSISRIPSPPLASHPTLPQVAEMPQRDTPPKSRRDSSFLRETKVVAEESTVHAGDVLAPSLEEERVSPIPLQYGSNRWRVVRLLGEGAFSAVWAAEGANPDSGVVIDKEPNAAVGAAAIKLISRKVCETHQRTHVAFAREVEVLRHLSHPNIVAFLGSFRTATHYCLVLERLSGGELFEMVARDGNRERLLRRHDGDKLGEGVVRRVFGELCTAAAWLHEVGIVHRDIKLENIVFTCNPFALSPRDSPIPLDALPRPLIKLTDFGLSRFISPTSPMLTTRCGSEDFAAPEIIMGKPYDGRLTDAWAVGVVLYALVAGELPFDEDAPLPGRARASSNVSVSSASGRRTSIGGSTMTTLEQNRRRMMRIAKGEYAWRDGVGSPSVRAVVNRLLVRDPSKRSRVIDVWSEEWMRGPGQVDRPDVAVPLAQKTGDRSRGRAVWAGFVAEGASDMARVESVDVDS